MHGRNSLRGRDATLPERTLKRTQNRISLFRGMLWRTHSPHFAMIAIRRIPSIPLAFRLDVAARINRTCRISDCSGPSSSSAQTLQDKEQREGHQDGSGWFRDDREVAVVVYDGPDSVVRGVDAIAPQDEIGPGIVGAISGKERRSAGIAGHRQRPLIGRRVEPTQADRRFAAKESDGRGFVVG